MQGLANEFYLQRSCHAISLLLHFPQSVGGLFLPESSGASVESSHGPLPARALEGIKTGLPNFRRMVALAGVLLLPLTACRESKPPKESPRKPSKTSVSPKLKRSKPLDKPLAGIDKTIVEFTGAHTRIVWAENQHLNNPDTFAYGDKLLLKGIDTRDEKGERMLQSKVDNYSRPLLTSDGEGILFTDKRVTKRQGLKNYNPAIYRTDWTGAKPVRIAKGYAVDCWRDPVSGVEWVYAVQELNDSNKLALEAKRLVRFRLDDPAREEIVYDAGPVSPDNIQFSRDGSLASVLFPWPEAGILVRGPDGNYDARKLQTGCWPSMAPDDSGVSWVFHGGHKGASFFAPGREKSWDVKFNSGPGMAGREMYHPRWSNHPRFMVLTGPYLPGKRDTRSVINSGGASAQVIIGRFSETLDRVEAWLQVTHDTLSESFPDMWIADGGKVQLAGFAKPDSAPGTIPAADDPWPVLRDDLIFLWRDRNAVTRFTDRDGKAHAAPQLEEHDAARYGRLEEMQVSGGHFEAGSDTAQFAIAAMQSRPEITVEMLLLPEASPSGDSAAGLRHVFRGPNLAIGMDDRGCLVVAQDGLIQRTAAPLPTAPFHLVVARRPGSFACFVNGESALLEPHRGAPPASLPGQLRFGGGWHGGILAVAIHDRALSPSEVKQESTAQLAVHARRPPAPPQVKVLARLVEASAMPSVEGIAPYTGALVTYVYDIDKVLAGELPAKRILVRHWAILDQKTVVGFPREPGKSHELILESLADHAHLTGERVVDDTTEFDLEPWFDVTPSAGALGGRA